MFGDTQQGECVAVIAVEGDGIDRGDEGREMTVRRRDSHDGRPVVELSLSAGTHQDEESAREEGAQNEHCAESQATADQLACR